MSTSQRDSGQKQGTPQAEGQPPAEGKQDPDKKSADDITPAPTGANQGSPVASVMKQFAKTQAESSGKA